MDPHDIHTITDWPRGEDNIYKIPTEISYEANGTYQCGHEVSNREDSLKLYKLLFLQEKDLPDEFHDSGDIYIIKKAREQLAGSGKTLIQVVADYLEHIW